MRAGVVAGVLLALLLLLPVDAIAGDASPDPSAAEAAEAEKPPVLPAPRAVDMPILVYHHVVPGHPDSVLFVTPESFEQHLGYLNDNGYRGVSFDDLADCLEFGVPLPDRPVIITFDDGWENQFQYAFPLLQKYGFGATFFVVTDYVDRPNFMTTDELKTMISAGMTIGSHSRSHPPLSAIGNPLRLKDEIAGSKAWLEERLGVPVDAFAYPYGSYTAAVVAAVRAAGYRTARTVDKGARETADQLETLPALLFPTYLNHYRDKVELAAGETRRKPGPPTPR